MKLTILSYLFLILSTSAFSQEYKTTIDKRFKEFNDLIITGEYSKSMNYIPDMFFEVVSKDQLIETFEQIMNNEKIEVQLLDFKITNIQDSKKIDSTYYVLLNYTSKIKMRFKISETETLEEQKTKLNTIKNSLINSFGSNNVNLDESTGFFTLTPSKKSCAISKDGLNDWKFINIEKNQMLIMEKILPKEILDTL